MDSRTQQQRIIAWLLANHRCGLSAMTAAHFQVPIMRLSNRVRELETDGCVFMRQKMPNAGRGTHMCYYLVSLENYHPANESDHPYADAIMDSQMGRM
jgi:hypothetical protein